MAQTQGRSTTAAPRPLLDAGLLSCTFHGSVSMFMSSDSHFSHFFFEGWLEELDCSLLPFPLPLLPAILRALRMTDGTPSMPLCDSVFAGHVDVSDLEEAVSNFSFPPHTAAAWQRRHLLL